MKKTSVNNTSQWVPVGECIRFSPLPACSILYITNFRRATDTLHTDHCDHPTLRPSPNPVANHGNKTNAIP